MVVLSFPEIYYDNQIIELTETEVTELLSVTEKLDIDITIQKVDDRYLFVPSGLVGTVRLSTRSVIIAPRHSVFDFDVILRMWLFVNFGNLDMPLSHLDTKPDNLASYVISLFLNELNRISSLRARYIQYIESLPYLRGNLKLPEHLIQSIGQPFSLLCVYDDLTLDNPINQMLASAIRKVKRSGFGSDSFLLNRLLNRFKIISNLSGSDNDSRLDSIIAHARSSSIDKHYELVLTLAKVILLDLGSTVGVGGSVIQAFLVNYDSLFQDFVTKVLMNFTNIKLTPTPEIIYADWQDDLGHDHIKKIQPDITHAFNPVTQTCLTVIDVKNKVPVARSNYFSPADVYEVSFYSLILKAERVILVYPLNSFRENYIMSIVSGAKILHLTAVFLNLSHNNSVDFYQEIRRFCDSVSRLL